MAAGENTHIDDHSRFDIIIVGGGTAGCVLASKLSALPHLKVLLVEAGINRNDDMKVRTPGLSRSMMGNPDYDWDFFTTPQIELENRVFRQTRGRMIGGTSAINSHSLLFPNKAMHEAWARLCGDDRWSWEQVKGCYHKFMEVQNVDEARPAKTLSQGPVQASYPKDGHVLRSAWEEVFEGLGALCNYEDQVEVGVGGLTVTNAVDARPGIGERSHSGKAYLSPVMGRSNLLIAEGALVERIMLDRREIDTGTELYAKGIHYQQAGRSVFATAEFEVVLCAGVFGSPQILELSGIGERSVLDQAGIECLLELPGVGGMTF